MSEAGPRRGAAQDWVRRNGANAALEAVANFLLPFLIFIAARSRLGEAPALMASSAPPILWSVVEFVRRRRIDAVSLLVVTGIALSLMAFLGGGGVRLLQLREKLVTGLVGLVFLASVAIGRPLIYYLARAAITRTSPAKAARFASLRGGAAFRQTMLIMTLAWGFALVAECALSIVLAAALTVKQFLLVGPVVGYGALAAMLVWTTWFARRRIGPAMQTAEGD
ncbi:MAG: VC0807 family protein [Phenylobacterium sp.]